MLLHLSNIIRVFYVIIFRYSYLLDINITLYTYSECLYFYSLSSVCVLICDIVK